MSVGRDRYYKHNDRFGDGTKYVVRHLLDGKMACVSREITYPARPWMLWMDRAVERGDWLEITKEEAEAL
jgi:hypothetical protein